MVKIFALLISIILATLTSLSFEFSSPIIYILVGVAFVIVYIVAIVTIFFVSATIMTIPVNKKEVPAHYNRFYQKVFVFYDRIVLSTFGVKIKAQGIEKLPKDSNFIIVGNHISNVDPLVTNMYLKDYPFIFASKKSLFNVPFFGKMIHKIGYLRLNRDNYVHDLKELERGYRWLKRDECSLAIYPEGTRNKTDQNLLPFKDTCFKFAMSAKKPIVISVISGTKEVNDMLLLKRHIVHYEIIKTLNYDDYKDMTVEEVSQYVYQTIEKRLIELKNS